MGIALHLLFRDTGTPLPTLSPYRKRPTSKLLLEKGGCELARMIHCLSPREYDAVTLASNVTVFLEGDTSPLFSHQVVAKRRKDRSEKAREGTRSRVGSRPRTVRYVEEAGGIRLRVARSVQHAGALCRCSRPGVRNAG